LQLARSEAVRRNVPVEVCVSSNGTSCGSGTSWAGWIVHGPDPGNGGADEVVRADTANGSVQVTSTVAKLVFKPSGQIDTQQTLTVCMPTTQPNINQRVLTVMVSGVVVSKNNDGGGACPA
jgi:type IV fimbrial biogenesis protein FimT